MAEKGSTGWVGWVYFAGALLLLNGGIQVVAGLTGIFNGNFYASVNGHLIAFNYGTWGWIHLLLGLVVIAAGIGVISGQTWARVVAIFAVIVAALSHFSFLSVYPLWSIVLLIIDALVIYALTMHGGEVKE